MLCYACYLCIALPISQFSSIDNISTYYTFPHPPHLKKIPPLPEEISSRLNSSPNASNPPSLQRQPLQPQCRRPNEAPKCHHPNHNTNHIHNIIAVPLYVANATSIHTSIFFGCQSAGKGVGGSKKGSFER